jgi:hypothetical protein
MYTRVKRSQQTCVTCVRLSAEQPAQLLDKEHFHDAEILGQLPGKMVVIQAISVVFNIGMLQSTLGDYVTWTIH